jgi:hypothetical protein
MYPIRYKLSIKKPHFYVIHGVPMAFFAGRLESRFEAHQGR